MGSLVEILTTIQTASLSVSLGHQQSSRGQIPSFWTVPYKQNDKFCNKTKFNTHARTGAITSKVSLG